MFVNKRFGIANLVDLEVDVLLIVLMSGMLTKLLRSIFRPSALTKRRLCITGIFLVEVDREIPAPRCPRYFRMPSDLNRDRTDRDGLEALFRRDKNSEHSKDAGFVRINVG